MLPLYCLADRPRTAAVGNRCWRTNISVEGSKKEVRGLNALISGAKCVYIFLNKETEKKKKKLKTSDHGLIVGKK